MEGLQFCTCGVDGCEEVFAGSMMRRPRTKQPVRLRVVILPGEAEVLERAAMSLHPGGEALNSCCRLEVSIHVVVKGSCQLVPADADLRDNTPQLLLV